MKEDVSNFRKSYKKGVIDDDKKTISPLELFRNWFNDATAHPDIEEPNTMNLVTLGVDGYPRSRIVLLKEFSEAGFVFYTNYTSRKGEAIAAHKKVGLSFFWSQIERQILIKGIAQKVSEKISDKYFYSRPKGSQIGAILSPQSKPIESRSFLDKEFLQLQQFYKKEKIKRPKYWGGYLVVPSSIEFWQGRPNRLHDRIEYVLQDNANWKGIRLAP